MQWRGPFPIIAKKSIMDYTIDFGHRQKTFHINMLKKYIRRDETENRPTAQANVANELTAASLQIYVPEILELACTSIIVDEPEAYIIEPSNVGHKDSNLIHVPILESKENFRDVHVNPDMTTDQISQVKRLITSYSDILTDLPGKTSLIGAHDIKLTDDIDIPMLDVNLILYLMHLESKFKTR